MPSRTLTLFNLNYLFSVSQCNLISVLFIISLCQILTVFIKIYIEFCGKSPKLCGRPNFPTPPPRPQTSAIDKHPSPLFADVLYGRPLSYISFCPDFGFCSNSPLPPPPNHSNFSVQRLGTVARRPVSLQVTLRSVKWNTNVPAAYSADILLSYLVSRCLFLKSVTPL